MYSNYNDLYTSLYHSGIKGMKWGVRRKATETRHVKTKNGLDVDLVRKDPSIIARALGKISPKNQETTTVLLWIQHKSWKEDCW
jgi:hypothetical protein|nr:MAG TPA: hypothetical protein [Caudoviricetes sp.]